MSAGRSPRRYFPVALPHRMPGEQRELGSFEAGERWIERDAERSDYLAAKRAIASPVMRIDDAAARADEHTACGELRRSIAGADPELAAEIAGLSTLDEVVGRIQEDLVLMRRAAGDARASTAQAFYLNVCFPTGWCPCCMLGLGFTKIHGPVPALHDFGAGRGTWGRYLFDTVRGATVRFVWTLTPDDRLDRRRCVRGLHQDAPPTSWEEATAAYFRIERQVVVPLTATLGMFLIRIYRHSVATLAAWERERLRESVAALDPKIAAYKGFGGHEAEIRRLLEEP